MRTTKVITPYFEDGEFVGVRVCIGDEDFVIAPKDYNDGKEMNWHYMMYDYGYPDTDCYVKVNPKKNMIHVNGRNANSNLYSHSFVHELQRALRLCGLNELADNFKVYEE